MNSKNSFKETLLDISYDGIREYLDQLGKLYVTPFGLFTNTNEVQRVTGLYKTTLLRRFHSKKKCFSNWYIVSGDSDLSLAETCEHCDKLDDLIFSEDCWLDMVDHFHDKPLEDTTKFKYLYKGNQYTTTYGDWQSGVREHLMHKKPL